MNVLFVTHKNYRCGVYQHVYNTVNILVKKAKKYNYIHGPCENIQEFNEYLATYSPIVVIYNYHPTVLGWITPQAYNIPQLAINHEPTMPLPAGLTAVISHDPTVQETPTLFISGRFVFDYENKYPMLDKPVIGSFGFGLPGKGFQRLVKLVQNEFDEAKIRLHIAYATYGDDDGTLARSVAEECRKLMYKPGIILEISHDFMDVDQLIDWLAQNTLNAFLYDPFPGRGISGPPDYALSARRPIAMTKSYMFKHMWDANPSIFVEDMTLKQIISNGLDPLQQYYDRWSEKQLAETYDRIVTAAINL
jgi:hypothetical protein